MARYCGQVEGVAKGSSAGHRGSRKYFESMEKKNPRKKSAMVIRKKHPLTRLKRISKTLGARIG